MCGSECGSIALLKHFIRAISILYDRFRADTLSAITHQKIALCAWFAYRARRAGDFALRRREALLVDFTISGAAPALYQPFA